MTNNNLAFGRNLVICLVTAFAICLAIELVCLHFGVAPFFAANVPLDQKLQFIRDHRPGSAPIGVISGASVALNDIDSDLLEDQEGQPFVNLGANALPMESAQRLYEQVARIFPVREVIFAADPLEMRDAIRAEVNVPTDVLRRYVLGKMTIAEEFTYRDISGLNAYANNWRKYRSSSDPNSLVFSKTGDAPLEINQETADPRLWNGDTVSVEMECTHCTDTLATFCREVRNQGLPFTVFLGPIREGVLEKNPGIRAEYNDRRARVQAVVEQCGGTLFDVTRFFTLSDACYANSVHLNAQGMRAVTEQLMQFRRGKTPTETKFLSCGTHPVAPGSDSSDGGNAGEHTQVGNTILDPSKSLR
jgi:hypothetical protein